MTGVLQCQNTLILEKKFDEISGPFLVDYTKYLKEFEEYLGNKKNKNWIANDSISIADFVVYEILEGGKTAFPNVMKDTPNLVAYINNFEKIDKIAAYISSSRYIKRPFNNPNACWR